MPLSPELLNAKQYEILPVGPSRVDTGGGFFFTSRTVAVLAPCRRER